MTTPDSIPVQDHTADKEKNFRMLEQKYERQLAAERQARMEAEKIAQEATQKKQLLHDDDDDDSEPYVDKRRLEKKLNKFGEQSKQHTQTVIKEAVQQAIQEERNNNWLKSNPDFEQVMEHAEKLAALDPDLAESILAMPNTFERQKLVYKNIKALGIDKPKAKESTIQEKVDANRRSPYYQPSGVGASPYHSTADFSAGGQKQAYDKMQELKNRLRLG